MKSKELRIGNWVDTNYGYLQVFSVDQHGCEIVDETGCVEYFEYDKINSIPLTEEILLKCGFEKVRYEKYAHVKLNKLRAYPHVMKDGFCIYLMGSYTLPHIKYLQQLQNIYFALTGQELEIKL